MRESDAIRERVGVQRVRASSNMSDEDWIGRARAIASGRAEVPRGGARVEGEAPVWLDGESLRAWISPFVAAVAWAGVAFRDLVASDLLDPFGLLLRIVGWATTTRAIWLMAKWLPRLRLARLAKHSVLVLVEEGLYVRIGSEERTAARGDIVGIVERGTWQTRSAGRRYSPVYVVLRHAVSCFVELPPIFDATPGVLAERLMRWAAIEVPAELHFPAPAPLASKVYEDAARGVRDPDTTVIKQGRGWLARGPVGVCLTSAVVLARLLASTHAERASLSASGLFWPLLLGAAAVLVAAPVVWLVSERRPWS
jgi:hypothetical protein